MNDELTAVDIKKMQDEIDYRVKELRPKLIEDVKVARAFGDLSENFEYKAAKREKNRNDSRIRYLQRMVSTAKVITDDSGDDTVGLFDKLTIYIEEDDETRDIRIVTTLRQNPLEGLISKESPVGKAVLGRRVGDRVAVEVSADYSYYIQIKSLEKGQDDEDLPIMGY
jgi:transcription elongation factor GreA